MEEQQLIAKTFRGLEEVLAGELVELGANNVQIGCRMVSFTGDKEMLYRANFCLRTAVRILKPILQFRADTPDDIYEAVKAYEWDTLIADGRTFSVDSVTSGEDFSHSRFITYRVKDAIVDYFREKTGKRPSVSISNPDIRLNLHATADGDCTLSLDSSGESLHQRGYRVATVDAPLNEVLAAGLILLSGWRGETDLYDPFCGSGTLLVEAALIAKGMAPGLFRKKFAFESWPDFDADLLSEIYDDDSREREFTHHIYGFDRDIAAVKAAEANAKSAGVADCVTVKERDVRDFEAPAEPAFMVTNPPYGDRLPSQGLLDLYASLGERLKNAFTGGTAWVISSREELLRKIGMRHSTRMPLFNGKIDCDFRKYQVFDGKLRDFRAEGGEVKTGDELRRNAEGHGDRREREQFRRRFDENEERPARSPRSDFADRDFVEENPDYIALRNRHRDFSAQLARRERRLEREERFRDRPRYDAGRPRREGDFQGKSRFGGDFRDRPRRDGDFHGRFRRDDRYGDRDRNQDRYSDRRFNRDGDRRFNRDDRNADRYGDKPRFQKPNDPNTDEQ